MCPVEVLSQLESRLPQTGDQSLPVSMNDARHRKVLDQSEVIEYWWFTIAGFQITVDQIQTMDENQTPCNISHDVNDRFHTRDWHVIFPQRSVAWSIMFVYITLE